jgi:hypothetical protein
MNVLFQPAPEVVELPVVVARAQNDAENADNAVEAEAVGEAEAAGEVEAADDDDEDDEEEEEVDDADDDTVDSYDDVVIDLDDTALKQLRFNGDQEAFECADFVDFISLLSSKTSECRGI